ncbi:molybdopterin dinucleotide binding domain-containing protein, partial [Endozoicomonas sp.]|uniref:molybdopterin dinucleotide binding domain-containing protein n=1 Tax=Endozoicomonas sp. TaxID=1892382 RepID=UPI00383B6D0B
KDKKIDLAPEILVSDLPRLKSRFIDPLKNDSKRVNSEFDLMIISRLTSRTLGWMHNSHRLVKGKSVCNLLIHPEDAAKRGINQESTVAVSSVVGRIDLPVEITEDIMPGVVCMPHAWGHNRQGTRIKVAEAHAGVSLNDITNEKVIDQLTGNAVVHGIPVKVEVAKLATAC